MSPTPGPSPSQSLPPQLCVPSSSECHPSRQQPQLLPGEKDRVRHSLPLCTSVACGQLLHLASRSGEQRGERRPGGGEGRSPQGTGSCLGSPAPSSLAGVSHFGLSPRGPRGSPEGGPRVGSGGAAHSELTSQDSCFPGRAWHVASSASERHHALPIICFTGGPLWDPGSPSPPQGRPSLLPQLPPRPR